jgi:lactate dehydrogenase-like 2-hydroxyacid dehydrogenase
MEQKILIARAIFPEVIERLARYFDVETNQEDTVLQGPELARRLRDKQGAFVAGDVIDAAVLAEAPHLRVVSNMAVGFNNFDLPAFDRAAVLATNTPDVLNESVADFAWALMLNAARRVGESERWLRSGAWRRWSYDLFLGQDLHGSTLGIIGMGRIGQAIAQRAQGFGMQVLYHNRSRVAADVEQRRGAVAVGKEELLRHSDHVVLVLPYTPQSRHTIGAAELALMKPTATLTNVARGGIVDDAALLDALRERRIAAAALDVFEGEPDFLPGLLELPNLVMTPHNAPGSEATRRRMAELTADNLIAALGQGPRAGRPPNPVNPAVMQRWST